MTAESNIVILSARWIAPMRPDQPDTVLTDSAVVMEGGRILDIPRQSKVRKAFPGAQVIELGNVLLLPAFINAHVHLELSSAEPDPTYNGDFVEWLLAMRKRIKFADRPVEDAVAEAMQKGIAQCLKYGIATVGDITGQPRYTRAALSQSPLRAVSFGEVIAMAGLRGRLDEAIATAVDPTQASRRLHIGLTPHAPYTVELTGYCKSMRTASEGRVPLATHLAEHPAEEQFLRDHQGPLVDLWKKLDLWQEPVETFAGSPVEMAERVGLLHRPAVLAHVNYVDDEDMRLLQRGHASVVYCPRTHRYFKHVPHRWREMLKSGINVAVGTDSCASSPNLNIVDDLRLLRSIAPEIPSATLWSMITWRAAKALGWDDQIGTLLPGYAADIVAFNVTGSNPLNEVLDNNSALPSHFWINGIPQSNQS